MVMNRRHTRIRSGSFDNIPRPPDTPDYFKNLARNAASAANATNQFNRSVKSSLPTIGASRILTVALGANLLQMALAGGAASNSMVRFESALEDLFDIITSPLTPLLDWFADLDERLQLAIIGVAALAFFFKTPLVSAIGGATKAMKGFSVSSLIAFATNPITLAIAATLLFAGAMIYLRKESELVRDIQDGIWQGIVNQADEAVTAITTVWRWLKSLYDWIANLTPVNYLEKILPDVNIPSIAGGGGVAAGRSGFEATIPFVPYLGGLYSALDTLFGVIRGIEQVAGGGGVPYRGANPPATGGGTYQQNNYYGASEAQMSKNAQQAQNDANRRSRANGGF